MYTFIILFAKFLVDSKQVEWDQAHQFNTIYPYEKSLWYREGQIPCFFLIFLILIYFLTIRNLLFRASVIFDFTFLSFFVLLQEEMKKILDMKNWPLTILIFRFTQLERKFYCFFSSTFLFYVQPTKWREYF